MTGSTETNWFHLAPRHLGTIVPTRNLTADRIRLPSDGHGAWLGSCKGASGNDGRSPSRRVAFAVVRQQVAGTGQCHTLQNKTCRRHKRTMSTARRALLANICAMLAICATICAAVENGSKAEEYFRELQNEERRAHEGYRSPAADKLTQVGDAAIPLLVKGMQSADPYVAKWSGSALRGIGPGAIGPLQALAERGERAVRTSALFMLATINVDQDTWRNKVLPVFVTATRDPDPELRKWGVYGIGNCRRKDVAEVLVTALRDESAIVRSQAALSLRQTGDSVAGMVLIAALQDTNSQVRADVACALGFRQDAGAVEALVSLRKDSSPLVRWNSVVSLGHLCDRRAVRHFVPFLDDFEESEHGAAAMEAAWEIGKLIGRDFGGYSRQRAIKAREWWDTEGERLYGSKGTPNHVPEDTARKLADPQH